MKSNKYTDKYNLYWFLTFIYSTFSGKIFKNNPFNSLIKIGLILIFQSSVWYTIFRNLLLKKVLGIPHIIRTINKKVFIKKLMLACF